VVFGNIRLDRLYHFLNYIITFFKVVYKRGQLLFFLLAFLVILNYGKLGEPLVEDPNSFFIQI